MPSWRLRAHGGAHLCSGRADGGFAVIPRCRAAPLFFLQVASNIGMVLQLLPVSGITLPFISAGGSNVLTMMIALGVLMSVSRSRHVC